MLPVFNPDLQVIGTIVNPEQPNSVYGAGRITELSGQLGIRNETVGVNSFADLSLATEALISRGAEVIVIPPGTSMSVGLPIFVEAATEQGLPVLVPFAQYVYGGATVGAGFYSMYREGVIAAGMLIGHLNGEKISRHKNDNLCYNRDRDCRFSVPNQTMRIAWRISKRCTTVNYLQV